MLPDVFHSRSQATFFFIPGCLPPCFDVQQYISVLRLPRTQEASLAVSTDGVLKRTLVLVGTKGWRFGVPWFSFGGEFRWAVGQLCQGHLLGEAAERNLHRHMINEGARGVFIMYSSVGMWVGGGHDGPGSRAKE